MENRWSALSGIVGLSLVYITIGISIILSPWFSWRKKALSDLGHVVKSDVAPLFNLGLLSSGFLILIYSVTAMREHCKHTSYFLSISSFLLQLLAIFDETYGWLHLVVSTLFFVSLGFTSIMYYLEKKSKTALLSFIIGLLTWLLYFVGAYKSGIAVPELVSGLAVTLWIIISALKIYLSEGTHP